MRAANTFKELEQKEILIFFFHLMNELFVEVVGDQFSAFFKFCCADDIQIAI